MSKCTCKSGFSVDNLLTDGTHTDLYGNMRLAQQTTTTEYFLTDALGSVRQLVDENGMLTLSQSYQPYGETLSSTSDGVPLPLCPDFVNYWTNQLLSGIMCALIPP